MGPSYCGWQQLSRVISPTACSFLLEMPGIEPMTFSMTRCDFMHQGSVLIALINLSHSLSFIYWCVLYFGLEWGKRSLFGVV